jgi:antirestriction protein ArdC
MSTNAWTPRLDAYRSITTRMLAALESGTAPWIRPWDAGADEGTFGEHRNVESGKLYRGINTLLLWMAGNAYRSTFWGTFRQWHRLGGRVRRGEKATYIVFFREMLVDDGSADQPRRVPLLRQYPIFNGDQIDGIDPAIIAPPPIQVRPPLSGRDAEIDAWFKRTGSKVRIGGTRAYYMPSRDVIVMPEPDRFRSANDWYSTLAHEHGHWTGHATRLNRNLVGWKASPSYAFEELVAELCSAFTCAGLGIAIEQLQHAEYVASWCAGMREHKTMIVSAASAAQRATDLLLESVGNPQPRLQQATIWVCCSKRLAVTPHSDPPTLKLSTRQRP